MNELNKEQLEKLGKEVIKSFHLVEVKGKYLTETGFRTVGEIGLMTWLLASVASLDSTIEVLNG